jgi:prepilin-type N-terminal cleavage/methylation domain-containing protein
MFGKYGMTLMEIIAVLLILSVAAIFAFPNFSTSTEKARASTVENNLLAIFTAQQNYKNNNNDVYCYDTGVNSCDNLADINAKLGLAITDDGTYAYDCPLNSLTCTATRTGGASDPKIKVTLNSPMVFSNINPNCVSASGWCP